MPVLSLKIDLCFYNYFIKLGRDISSSIPFVARLKKINHKNGQ
jgi:hypothetical protein